MANFTNEIISDCIAKSYLQIVQNNFTEVNIGQILDITCKSSNQICNDCIEGVRKSLPTISDKESKKLCEPVCNCNISNINMNQNITLNLTSIQESKSKELFIDELRKNIILNASKNGKKLFFDNSRTDSLNIVSEKIYTKISSSQFSEIMESLLSLQSVKLNSTNIHNISLDNTVNITKVIIQNSTLFTEEIAELSNTINELLVQYVESAISAIIKVLAYIVLIIAAILLSLSIVYIGFQIAQIY